MRSCAAVTLVLMLLLFGIPWLAEAPEGDRPNRSRSPLRSSGGCGHCPHRVGRAGAAADDHGGVSAGGGAGEMPAAFSQQALDAQAVAERTFICYHMAGGRKDAHPEADVCTSPACCSAYVSQGGRSGPVGGTRRRSTRPRCSRQCGIPTGRSSLYDGSPILAAFHSSSAGVTADSGDVWSSSLPYLHSVETPEGGGQRPQLLQRQYLLPGGVPGDLSGGPWGCRPLRRPGGVVPGSDGQRLRPGGACDHRRCQRGGTEVRQLFSLRSACFTVDTGEEGVAFGSRASVTAWA